MINLKEGTPEFLEIKKEWGDKAKKATIENLPTFLTELVENYNHDYGTICHAVATAAIAAAWAIDHSKQGGVTGFQAGCIMWQFVRDWNNSSNKTAMKLIDYDNFLYPQYKDDFDKTISKDIWESIKKEARFRVDEADKDYAEYLEKLSQYEKDIAVFVAKNHDYYERRKHYDPLGMGTGSEWDAEEKKKADGFKFAPQEPCCPVNSESLVYKHWKGIVMGNVPFGYSVKDKSL